MAFLKSSIARTVVILFLPVAWIAGFLFFYKAPFHFLNNPSRVHPWSFTDSLDLGHSRAQLFSLPNGNLRFLYRLHPGYQYPYAGVNFVLNPDSLPDLSGFDYIELTLKATAGSRLPVVMGIRQNHHTKPGGIRFMEYIVPVGSEWSTVKIELDRFRSPEWWWKQNGKKEGDLREPDFSSMRFVNVQSCQLIGNDKEDEVEISAVRLGVDMTWFYQTGFVLSAFYCGLAFVLLRHKKPIQPIVFSYIRQETENRSVREADTVLDYITSHYDKPNLTILDIQTAVGISESKISSHIKTKTGLTFKQFLNKLRLTESRRLLSESDLQISEIAYKVGYSNVSHFNRIFKETEACSPNDYRKQAIVKP